MEQASPDQVGGKLVAWDEQKLTLEAAAGTLSFPVKQVREIWRGSESEVAKARAAVHFRRPTKAWEDRVLAGFPNAMSIPGVVAAEGGVPLAVDGQIIGAIGISGGTSAEDGVIATTVIDTLKELV